MQVVSIVGVGLIGTSFALALRKAGFSGEILGVSSPASLAAGIQMGAITRGVTLSEAAAHSDLLYLSQPIDQILLTLERLGSLLHSRCLVTDAGSTKTVIARTAFECLPAHCFLGGHPMAGKEQRGAQAADPELFRHRPYVLTGAAELENPQVSEFRNYLQKMGAKIVEMSPEQHDRTVALTSHLPQLLSTCLAITLAANTEGETTQVFGPGLLDMTRLALSAPDVWLSVLATNQAAIDDALQQFEYRLRALREALNEGAINPLFEQASKFATAIRVSS